MKNACTLETKLIIGDWSHDGHCQIEAFKISSNLCKKEITSAYKKGTKILGFDFCKSVAIDYENSFLSEEQMEMFLKRGFDINELMNDTLEVHEDEGYYLNTEDFLYLYLFIVKLGNNNFQYLIVDDVTDRINIGGYGL